MKRMIFLLLFTAIFAGCRKETVSTVDISGPNTTVDKQAVGQSAHQLLGADTYTNLTIEIQYAPGMKPQDQSITNLTNFLNTYLNKPGGVTVVQKQVGSIGAATVSTQDIVNFEDKNRAVYTDGNMISVYLYFADADYTESGVIGVSFRNTSIAIFEKTIQAKTGGINQASRVKVESGTLMHEMGHLLGLVNNGTAMVNPHEDASHKAHCSNSNCLMYYAIQTSGLMNALDNSIPALDADCVNDLKANGGK
ncbi:MAG: hypothetical protein V4450_04425 [Bacteroidota bacterium]